jgi:hypothetical protein
VKLTRHQNAIIIAMPDLLSGQMLVLFAILAIGSIVIQWSWRRISLGAAIAQAGSVLPAPFVYPAPGAIPGVSASFVDGWTVHTHQLKGTSR